MDFSVPFLQPESWTLFSQHQGQGGRTERNTARAICFTLWELQLLRSAEKPLLLNVRLLSPPLPPPQDCLRAGCERMEKMKKTETWILYSFFVLGDLGPGLLARTRGDLQLL